MRPDGWLLAVCLARALMTSIFMTYAAALPVLRPAWGMSATAAGSISTGSQLGYAVSLVVFSSLADRLGARRVFVSSAWLSAIAALAFAFGARSYVSGLVLYTLVAVSQGGAYTTAIMLIADRYPPERRGSAVGWLIASSSLGYALSLVVSGIALSYGYEVSFVVAACGPLLGACMLVLALRTTPNVVHPRRTGLRFGSAVVRNARAMRLMLGYTFHSWELLGMWAWTPAFIAAALAFQGTTIERAAGLGALLSAIFHVMGILASATGGALSDRWGRTAVIAGMMLVSSACSFGFGWMLAAPLLLIVVVGSIYGFSALGDSSVYSTGITETVKPERLGSALAVRSLLGFGAGAVAPLVFGAVLDLYGGRNASVAGWGWAFSALGVGGVLGLLSMLWLRTMPEASRLAGGKR